MRRDYFSLDVSGRGWLDEAAEPERPELVIDFEGPASLLQERITGGSADLLEAAEIDVSFRFLTDIDEDEPEGVVSVSDRVTGEFVLELNADAERILEFVRAAREYEKRTEDDDLYRVVIRIEGEEVVTYAKSTFLLYNADGNLLRKHSLIPSGVEL